MSIRSLPLRVRAHLYLFWVGMAVAGLGVVGFFFSFWQVGSASQASIDVHTDVPVLAYAAILAWLVGLLLMWYSRRTLDAAVERRLAERGSVEAARAPHTAGDESAPDSARDEGTIDAVDAEER